MEFIVGPDYLIFGLILEERALKNVEISLIFTQCCLSLMCLLKRQ